MVTVAKTDSSNSVPQATWKITDILGIYCAVLCCIFVTYIMIRLFFGVKITPRISQYIGSLLFIFGIPFWLKWRYRLSRDVLGIRKGRFPLSVYVPFSLSIALVYSILLQFTPLRFRVFPELQAAATFFNMILLPISFGGFQEIILTPTSEEIFCRGLLYAYFRTKLGALPGLLLQAVIFSLLHYEGNYAFSYQLVASLNTFVVGIILGVLYEKTHSIYPSIICHAMLNYLSTTLLLFWNKISGIM